MQGHYERLYQEYEDSDADAVQLLVTGLLGHHTPVTQAARAPQNELPVSTWILLETLDDACNESSSDPIPLGYDVS